MDVGYSLVVCYELKDGLGSSCDIVPGMPAVFGTTVACGVVTKTATDMTTIITSTAESWPCTGLPSSLPSKTGAGSAEHHQLIP